MVDIHVYGQSKRVFWTVWAELKIDQNVNLCSTFAGGFFYVAEVSMCCLDCTKAVKYKNQFWLCSLFVLIWIFCFHILNVANALLIVIMRSDVLEKLRLQMVSYSVLDPNYFAIVCARGWI
jgi:hypothetical protein